MDVWQDQFWLEDTTLIALDMSLERNIAVKLGRVRSNRINMYTTNVTPIVT